MLRPESRLASLLVLPHTHCGDVASILGVVNQSTWGLNLERRT
jgi:hypothetical protein